MKCGCSIKENGFANRHGYEEQGIEFCPLHLHAQEMFYLLNQAVFVLQSKHEPLWSKINSLLIQIGGDPLATGKGEK